MKKFAAACALGCVLTAVIAGAAGAHTTTRDAARAGGPITFGVADDMGKFADDGGAWFNQQLKGASLSEERWTLSWTGGTTINELPFLQRSAPQAQKDGIKVELALYGRPASNNDPTAFCAWAANVAKTVSQWGIHDYIVWNEPNTALYWSPQDDSAPAKYEALLAACYDSIHAADPSANVIGFGLSPRKGTSTQTSPIDFIAGAGAAYKASGRTKPIMDMLSVHPYPNPNNPTDGPDVGYSDTKSYGIPNLDRVKQAVYDAWNKTGQPTTLNGLLLVLDEVGWQTVTTAYSQYIHDENVKTVSESQQTQYLQVATQKYFACDPTIATVNWFLLVDENTRDGKDASGTPVGGGWQSGLLTAGGKGVSAAKQAYATLASIWAKGRAACTGAQINWSPAGSTGGGDSNGGGSTGGGGGLTGGGGTNTSPVNVQNAQGLVNLYTAFFGQTADSSALSGMFNTLNSLTMLSLPLGGPFTAALGSAGSIANQILGLLGPTSQQIGAFGGLVFGTGGTLNPSQGLLNQLSTPGLRALSQAHAATTVLAKGSATIPAGATGKLKLTASSKAKVAKAGNLFLVLAVRAAKNGSKPVVFVKKVATVKAAPKKAKPTKTTPKKKGKK